MQVLISFSSQLVLIAIIFFHLLILENISFLGFKRLRDDKKEGQIKSKEIEKIKNILMMKSQVRERERRFFSSKLLKSNFHAA